MLRKPLVINDHDKIEVARTTSLKYLEEHEDLQAGIARYLLAYHEIGNLVPQTVDKFMSGHSFPYSESYLSLKTLMNYVWKRSTGMLS